MEIANIKGFAEAYNDLRTYFNRIEPYEVRQISMFPVVTGPYTSRIKKSFKADAWDIPCNSETFGKLYDGFIEELSNAVLEYSQQTVQVMLESYFSNSTDAFSNDDVFVNSLGDIFKNDREDLIELIELFYKTRKQINNLITDSGAGYYGLIGYYDSFREEAMKKRLQKGNETKKASTNESVHKSSEDEAIKSIQQQGITSNKENRKQPTFRDIIQSDDKEKLLKRLHYLIDGKSGADVGAVLLKAQQEGYLTKIPTRGIYESEFTLIGYWQSVHNYMNNNSTKALDKANKIIIFN